MTVDEQVSSPILSGLTGQVRSPVEVELPNQAEVTDAETGTAIFNMQSWLSGSPFRIAAGWSLLAGALMATGGEIRNIPLSLAQAVLLFLLVDPLWGALWGAVSNSDSVPRIGQSIRSSRAWLPYLRSGSPAARLFGHDGPGLLPLLFRVALPGISLSFLVAYVLGPTALIATLVVLSLSVSAWLHQFVALIPTELLHVPISVTLPWLMGLFYFGGADLLSSGPHLVLIFFWTLHMWGVNRHRSRPDDRLGIGFTAFAQAGIGALLVWLQLPVWLIPLMLFFLPTWLSIYRGQQLERVAFWWLLALLTSGFALSSPGL